MVQRYINTRPTPLFPSDNGPYVTHADYATLTAHLEALLAVVLDRDDTDFHKEMDAVIKIAETIRKERTDG